MMNAQKTPMETLIKIYELAKEIGILYCYIGNVSHDEYNNTYCSKCGNLCISRHGYLINLDGIKNGKCLKCGESLSLLDLKL
jgi:pyruvate formate lyase activating enzyme